MILIPIPQDYRLNIVNLSLYSLKIYYMNYNIGNFFLTTNTIEGISDEEYEKAALLVNAAKAFARSTYQCVYIIDYFKREFVYVSENLALLCDQPADKIKEFGYNLYLKHVPEKEVEMLMEINKKGFDLFSTIPSHERMDYSIQYDFHLINEKKPYLIHHTLTPLTLTKDGKIWLALCTVSMSSRKTPGHIVMKKENNKEYHEYDLARHQWVLKEEKALSGTERDVLWLSTQGYTMNEIADKLCKSVDTIKSCKRSLFTRLGVKNIAEALYHAVNYRLL